MLNHFLYSRTENAGVPNSSGLSKLQILGGQHCVARMGFFLGMSTALLSGALDPSNKFCSPLGIRVLPYFSIRLHDEILEKIPVASSFLLTKNAFTLGKIYVCLLNIGTDDRGA